MFFSVHASQTLDIKKLTLEEKVGQLLLIGINSTDLDKGTSHHLSKIKPGGIILFKKNISSLSDLKILTQQLQNHTKVPLFIAVDQEGGAVSRIETKPHLPSARWVGTVNSPDLTFQLGIALGRVLSSYGINMNLAPVLDVSHHGQKTFLGSRSFSSDPNIVAVLGTKFSEGLLASGVLPTAKHFPGLGSISQDLHNVAVENSLNIKELHSTHLVPFKMFSELPTSAVMLSHASYPSVDSTNVSATYSSVISNKLLRDQLDFKGLVVTDDLMMEGAKKGVTFEESVVKAINSGADILLFAWSKKSQIRAKNAILRAVKNGKISHALLNEKVIRILKTKSELKDLNREKRNLASSTESLEANLKNIIYKMALVRRSRTN